MFTKTKFCTFHVYGAVLSVKASGSEGIQWRTLDASCCIR